MSGIPIPPIRLLQVMSPDEWEVFTEEWLYFHKDNGTYQSIQRFSGPGDLGLDVVAFSSNEGFSKPWDSFQCKHYNHALTPGDVYGEIGKIVYHSYLRTPPFNQLCRVPQRHVFVAPLGVGIQLGRLLRDTGRLKEVVRAKWTSHCVPAIGAGIEAPLEDGLLKYFDDFNFAIFENRNSSQLVEEHSQTVFHAARFGGGFPPRDEPDVPPSKPTESESVYLRKLLQAYGDHLGFPVTSGEALASHAQLENHYNRQRVLFYSAESLRNFARDRTPERTFDLLQDDVYNGVIDICEAEHSDALERLRNTVSAAGQMDVSGNALASVTRVADKQGICHQLANDDRLTWTEQP
ncbi:restriction endonuclease [Candidatus Poribacteria bacterium]|nr:restriction endonuclease [Candidatus Poribacteria bacterium]